MVFRDGHRFSRTVKLSPAKVSSFAKELGDNNPLHCDQEFAKASRYGRLIASGPQTSAILMGFTASYFSQFSPMVGLEFSFRFKAPVPADDKVKLEWMVVQSRPSKKFGGSIIELRGRLQDSQGKTAIGATGKVLLSQKL